MNEIKKIIETYDTLSNLKKNFKKNFVSEAVFASPVPLPAGFKGNFAEKRPYEIHPGTDIPVPSGTEIKAPADGVVVTANPNLNSKCGGTIDIDYGNGLWSRFCHVKRLDVKSGDRIAQGDVVGLTGGGTNDVGRGNSGGPHLHFSLKKDGQKVDPVKYLDSYQIGDQNLADIKPNTSTSSDDDDDQSSSGTSTGDTKTRTVGDNILGDFIDKLGAVVGLKEGKNYGSFGKGVKDYGGSYLISKDQNSIIYSPVSGKINNIRIKSGCKNQVTIYHQINGKDLYLEFCGISKLSVSDGDSVSKGTVLGKTSDDVIATLYNKNRERLNIKSYSDSKESTTNNNKTNKSSGGLGYIPKKEVTSYRSKTGYQDPVVDLLGSVLTYPARYLERKKRKDLEKKQQDSLGKLEENIERIKKLLK